MLLLALVAVIVLDAPAQRAAPGPAPAPGPARRWSPGGDDRKLVHLFLDAARQAAESREPPDVFRQPGHRP